MGLCSSSGRAGSSVASVPRTPPFPGSNVRTRDRTQALQAYYQQSTAQSHQPDSPIVSRGPVFPSGPRPSRGSASSSSDQSGGGSRFLWFNIWEREPYMQPQQAYQVNQMEREPSIWASTFNEGGGSFHQRHGGGGPSWEVSKLPAREILIPKEKRKTMGSWYLIKHENNHCMLEVIDNIWTQMNGM